MNIGIEILNDEVLKKAINSDDLYAKLGFSSNQYKRWCESTLKKYGSENVDYYLFNNMLVPNPGRTSHKIIYRLTVNFAKELCMISRTPQGKELREYLINLDSQAQTGQLFDRKQINFLLELTKVMGLFSVQDKVESDHFHFHNNQFDWWNYRAKILGYGTSQLKIEVEKLNRKYKSMKQALMITDQYELIRVGIIDLFIALGKTPEFAANVADLCKDFAKQMKTPIWDDSPKKNSIPFNLNVNKGLENSIKNNQLKLSK